jgi:hypothetical protein
MIAPLTNPGTGIAYPIASYFVKVMLSDLQHTQDVCRSVSLSTFYKPNDKTTIDIKPSLKMRSKNWIRFLL